MISVSAVAGSDYTMATQSLIFPVGNPPSTIRCIDISIIDDEAVEGDETFSVVLTVITPGVDHGNTETTVTILPDADSQ